MGMGHLIYFQTYPAAEKVLVVIITSTSNETEGRPRPHLRLSASRCFTHSPFMIHQLFPKKYTEAHRLKQNLFFFFLFFLLGVFWVFLLGDQAPSTCQFLDPHSPAVTLLLICKYFIRKSFDAFTKLPALLPPNLLPNFGKKRQGDIDFAVKIQRHIYTSAPVFSLNRLEKDISEEK
jgi:hypothetical protein